MKTSLLIGVGISIFLVFHIPSCLRAASCSYSVHSSCEKVRSEDLQLSLEYPTTWKFFEAGPNHNTLNDFNGVISLDVLNDTKGDSGDSSGYTGLENPLISIVFSDLPFHNITLSEYAKIRILDFKMLFSDLGFHVIRSNQSNGSIDGLKNWIFEYSFSIDQRVDRYGMEIWMLRGYKVYEISYIADGYAEYMNNLDQVKNLTDSITFIN